MSMRSSGPRSPHANRHAKEDTGTMTTTPLTCDLTPDEVLHLEQALTKVGESGADPAGTDFYDRGWPTHSLLPGGLVDFLEHFRTREPGAACLIRGLPVADDQVGPTP